MCAGRTLVNPALAHHHPSPNNSPPDLEGGTTIADDEGGSIWWGRDAEVESKPAGGPARQPQPAASNDEMVANERVRLQYGNARRNEEVEAKIFQAATSTLEEYPTRQMEATAVALEEYPTRQIETTAVAPGEAPQELTIRRLGASRTVLGSIVNVKTTPGLWPLIGLSSNRADHDKKPLSPWPPSLLLPTWNCTGLTRP
jgi:hypothetical protein